MGRLGGRFLFGVGDEAGIVMRGASASRRANGLCAIPNERSAGFVAMKTIAEMDCAMVKKVKRWLIGATRRPDASTRP